jgi:phage gpG-like protein
MGAEIKVVKDNRSLVEQMMHENVERGLEAIGLTAEGYAKKLCPVDTGRLRNSITHATKHNSGKIHSYSDDEGNSFSDNVGQVSSDSYVCIGTNVEYAAAIELGTHNHGAQPYLKPAMADHVGVYRTLMEKALKGEDPT